MSSRHIKRPGPLGTLSPSQMNITANENQKNSPSPAGEDPRAPRYLIECNEVARAEKDRLEREIHRTLGSIPPMPGVYIDEASIINNPDGVMDRIKYLSLLPEVYSRVTCKALDALQDTLDMQNTWCYKSCELAKFVIEYYGWKIWEERPSPQDGVEGMILLRRPSHQSELAAITRNNQARVYGAPAEQRWWTRERLIVDAKVVWIDLLERLIVMLGTLLERERARMSWVTRSV